MVREFACLQMVQRLRKLEPPRPREHPAVFLAAPGQRRHLQMRKLRQPVRWQPHRRARHLHDSGLSPYAQRRGIRAATASRTSFDADVYPRGCAPFPSCPPRPHLRPHSHFCSFVESLSAPAGFFSLQSHFYLSPLVTLSSLAPLLGLSLFPSSPRPGRVIELARSK